MPRNERRRRLRRALATGLDGAILDVQVEVKGGRPVLVGVDEPTTCILMGDAPTDGVVATPGSVFVVDGSGMQARIVPGPAGGEQLEATFPLTTGGGVATPARFMCASRTSMSVADIARTMGKNLDTSAPEWPVPALLQLPPSIASDLHGAKLVFSVDVDASDRRFVGTEGSTTCTVMAKQAGAAPSVSNAGT